MYKEALIRKTAGTVINSVRFCFRDSVGSTNDELEKAAKKGEDEIFVMLANSQTGGKGRMGRTFHSPKGGIYMSILLRPDFSAEDCALLTPMTATALCDAIDDVFNIKADIKWVNDIYCNGKKAAGILTKAQFSATGRADYVIIGVGINLSEPADGFHEDIKAIATSLTDSVSKDAPSLLVGAFLKSFLGYYKNPCLTAFSEKYHSRLLYKGENITVHRGEETYPAIVLGADERCRLMIKKQDGEALTLTSEEITIRPL